MSENIVLSRTAQKILYAMAVEGDKDLGAFSTELWNVTKGDVYVASDESMADGKTSIVLGDNGGAVRVDVSYDSKKKSEIISLTSLDGEGFDSKSLEINKGRKCTYTSKPCKDGECVTIKFNVDYGFNEKCEISSVKKTSISALEMGEDE